MPKSSTFTPPPRTRKTFSGLMSRCTTPFVWAAPRTSSTAPAMASASAGGILRPLRSHRASTVSPSRSSITRNGSPSSLTSSSSTLSAPGCPIVFAA